MGTVGNQNPWTPPYDNYKDCSLGICSIYCPQFCYLIFPPPPQKDDSTPFSPLIIAIIGVLASVFILVSYYRIVTRYCKRPVQPDESEENHQDFDERSQWNAVPAGLDEASIRNITVCKYRKGDGLIERNECAVCLSEFQENESLRLLPKCDHAFHLPCIDTWLRTHSNCPLCRASVVSLGHPSPNVSRSQVLPTVNVSAYEMQRPNDLILVVEDDERNCNVFSGHDADSDDHDETRSGTGNEVAEEDSGTRGMQFRRSVSLGTFSCNRQASISDYESCKEIGSSSKGLLGSSVHIKRSVSTGRLVFTVHDTVKNSVLPS